MIVMKFIDAFNRGDRKELRRYSEGVAQLAINEGTGKRRRQVSLTDDRDVARYFARRHAANERLHLLVIAAGKQSIYMPNHAGIVYWLSRRASDLRSLGIVHPLAMGKGIVDCRKRTIFYWGFGMPSEPPVPRPFWPHLGLCPLPAGWRPANAVVACS